MSEPQQPWRPKFKLKYLLIAVAAVSGLLALYVNFAPPPPKAVAYLHVKTREDVLVNAVARNPGKLDLEREKRRVIDKLKSPVVLGQVTGQRRIASLPLISAQGDPIAFLRDQLSFTSENSEILEVSLAARTNDPAQLKKIVDEVLFACATLLNVERRQGLHRDLQEVVQKLSLKRETLERLATRLDGMGPNDDRLKVAKEIAGEQDKYKELLHQELVLKTKLNGPEMVTVIQPAYITD